mgnify:CR=1 FL=1
MEKKQNDSLALIVGGLFILALLFTTYNYFNKGRSTQDSVEQRIQELQALNQESEQQPTDNDTESEQQENNEEQITQDAASDQRDQNQDNQEQLQEQEYTQQNNIAGVNTVWVANDYNQGDISGDTYTVKQGDTLWEIAEAVYGDGSLWVNILNSNSDSIGYLSNGQQALIVPGQVLNLVQ